MKKPSTKIIAIAIAGSLVVSPLANPRPAEAGILGRVITKVVMTTAKTAIDKGKGKKLPPVMAGYKKGANPLPKGYKASTTYKNIWKTLKSDIGLK